MLHKVLLFQASPCLWMSTLFFAYFGKSTWTPLYLSFSLTPHTEYIGTSRCSSFKPIYLTISSAPWSTSPSACMWDALLAEFLIPQSVPHWSQRDSHTMHITPRYSSAQTLCSLCHSHIYRFLRLLLLSLAPPHPALASRPHYKAHSHLRISALSIPSSRMFFGCAGSFLPVQASLVVARWLSSSVACGTLSSWPRIEPSKVGS